ncbi:MAG: fumarylacetoacetase, partial [Acidobacteria bacterium]
MAQSVRSFIEVARDSHFPIQNLPFGVFQPRDGSPRIGVAIGNLVLDLSILEELGHLDVVTETIVGRDPGRQRIFGGDSLNAFMALGRPAWKRTRDIVQHLLGAETATLRDNAELRDRVFHEQNKVTMLAPARIGDYTDFYSSYHHAHNVGTMLRGP